MAARLLFASNDRAVAHEELERVIGSNPRAECREDPNSEKPYQVWDGPQDWEQAPSSPPLQADAPPPPSLSDEDIDRIAKRLKALGAP